MTDLERYPILVKPYRGLSIRKANDDNERYAVFSAIGILVHYGGSVTECEMWIDRKLDIW